MPNDLTLHACRAWPWVHAAVAAGLRGQPVPPVPADRRPEVLAAVAAHRLQGLCYRWGGDEADWGAAYWAAVPRAEWWLREAHRLAGLLESHHIPCLVLRGPLAGLRWHGDPAVRTFADLDLLVPRPDRRRAHALLMEGGYVDQAPARPLRYYDAVHYHYALHQPGAGFRCDVHWAVDHPFRRLHLPYERIFETSSRQEIGGRVWRVASPAYDILLNTLHLAKEWRQAVVDTRQDPLGAAWWTGQLGRWIDLARQQDVLAGCYDPQEVLERAREAGAGREARQVLSAAARLREAGLPADGMRARPRLVVDAPWHRWRRLWRGCRRFIAPPPQQPWAGQVNHLLRALRQLGRAGGLAVGCLILARLRPAGRMP